MSCNDFENIKEVLVKLYERINILESKIDKIIEVENIEDEERYSVQDCYHKLSKILNLYQSTQKEIPNIYNLLNPEKLLTTYEIHIKKIHEMLLEFKGCISMARSALVERKKLDDEVK